MSAVCANKRIRRHGAIFVLADDPHAGLFEETRSARPRSRLIRLSAVGGGAGGRNVAFKIRCTLSKLTNNERKVSFYD